MHMYNTCPNKKGKTNCFLILILYFLSLSHFFSPVCACMCTYVRMCVCMNMCMWVHVPLCVHHAHKETRRGHECLLQPLSIIFFETESLPEPEQIRPSRLAGQGALGSLPPSPPRHWGSLIQTAVAIPRFSHGLLGNLNSVPHACPARNLLTESSPIPYCMSFKKLNIIVPSNLLCNEDKV